MSNSFWTYTSFFNFSIVMCWTLFLIVLVDTVMLFLLPPACPLKSVELTKTSTSKSMRVSNCRSCWHLSNCLHGQIIFCWLKNFTSCHASLIVEWGKQKQSNTINQNILFFLGLFHTFPNFGTSWQNIFYNQVLLSLQASKSALK